MRSKTVAFAAAFASFAFVTGIGAALARDDDERSARSATATLRDTTGQRVGIAVFKERHGEVTLSADVRRLAPGFHGFHVHAVGQCVAPFTSAGPHFNPGATPHGNHAGDLPSLLVNEDGTGELQAVTDRFSVADLLDADGSALIVHAGRDNFANIPERYHSHTYNVFGPDQDTLATGDAGARAACGVVERRSRD